jgi:FkbM family methyltransferase
MVNKKSVITTVLDIGARYGVHPSWKLFTGEKKIILLEPDKSESERLKKKYKNFNDIKIFSQGIHPSSKNIYLNIFENPAMSSTFLRNNISPLFWHEKKQQLKIKKKIKIKCVTLDEFISIYSIKANFLKIDIEGLEPEILEYSKKIFDNLIGIRSEVSFIDIFRSKKNYCGTFSKLHEIMVNNGFVLLNLDYRGNGDFFSKYISPKENYGILQNTDAVWVKNPSYVIKYADDIYTLKIASFLILNNGADLALYLLEKLSKKFRKFKRLRKTKLYNFIYISILKHFYKLKWIPGQSIKEHKFLFEHIFYDKYLTMNEFNENNEINPY